MQCIGIALLMLSIVVQFIVIIMLIISIVVQCIGIALLMLSIVVQFIVIKMLIISIVVQCNGIKLCAMHWDSIAYDQNSCAIIG